MDAIFPRYRIWNQFLVRELQPALEADSLSTTHPLNLQSDISYQDMPLLLDEITLRKGASVMRQLTLYMENSKSHSTFQQAIRMYLQRNMFGTISALTIWNAMQQSTGLPINRMMRQWSWQIGFPIIYVDSLPDQPRFVLPKQHPSFFLLYSAGGGNFNSSAGLGWSIPILAQTSEGKRWFRVQHALRGESMSLPAGPRAWLKLNNAQVGYFRTKYNSELTRTLTESVRQLDVSDTSGLVDDLFALGVQRDSAKVLRQAMELSHAIRKSETDYVVWAPILKHLRWMALRLEEPNCHKKLLKTAQNIIEPIIAMLGWTPQWHHEKAMLQAQALAAGLEFGFPGLAETANRIASTHGAHLPASLSEVIYRGYTMEGGMAAFRHMIALYKNEHVPSQEEEYINAMASSKDPGVLHELLMIAVAKDGPIKTQHLASLFSRVAISCKLINDPMLLWKFLQDHWDQLEGKYGTSSRQAVHLIIHAGQYLQGEDQYMQVAEWLDQNGFQGTRVAKWALLNMRINSHFNQYLGNKKACLQWIN
eukprot:TRINITY_DN6211_c0_g1_i2.p1 TRINITY_DN6211_c0_g1~~TRINITY_DN6211_c0_g1_i2.p1  ORF type:complete len:535 (-),score=129.25 TRINITY_DN6211_c0_g1_i2:219-1823(-)